MQTVSAVYTSIMNRKNYKCEWCVDINGIRCDQYKVRSIHIRSAMFSKDTPAVGACISAEIRLRVDADVTIPRMAEIKPLVRVYDATQTSEWLPMGVFFVDTRTKGTEQNTLDLIGYDAMLKAEQTYLTEDDTAEWPQTMAAVVSSICTRMGVELDSRTAINETYNVEYPNDLTMREILGYIAAAHGGCWIMTPAGKLRLVTLAGSGDTIDLGQSVQSFSSAPTFQSWTKVVIWYDDEACYTSGVATGRTMELDCPWATQYMADTLLANLSVVSYTPYEAAGAMLDPAAELGDTVTVGSVSGLLASIDADADVLFSPDIGAPGEEEIDHEYPYLSPQQRDLKRTLKLGHSYYGTRITRDKGLTIEKLNDAGESSTRAVFNSDELAFYDAAGNKVLYFDPVSGQYQFIGNVYVQDGKININDRFVVDANGNVTMTGESMIYGGRYYAGRPDEAKGYTEMTPNGLRIINALGQLKLILGYTSGDYDYPYVELGSGTGTGATKGLIKKFGDGLWIGNNAPKDASGIFSAAAGYIGLFFSFDDNKAYVVENTNMKNIYTGDAIARFG